MSPIQQFPVHLKNLREDRQLTLSNAALIAGISKSTLHTWESGHSTPRAPELKQYLETLELNSAEKVRLLKLLDVPRAMTVLGVDKADHPPLTGDILRGLRLRQQKTQTEVASHLGVHQATLAKWEHSEDWPSDERLHSLCFYLKATTEEVETILSGIFLPEPTEGLEVGDTIGNIKTKLQYFEWDKYFEVSDLWFLSLESQVWWLAQQREAARELQYSIWFLHANYLIVARRWEESKIYLQQIFREQKKQPLSSIMAAQQAVILQGKIIALQDRNTTNRLEKAEKAVNFLTRQEALMIDPECQAWYWMELANYLAITLRKEDAWECCKRSNAIPYEWGNRLENNEAKLATATVSIQIGQWEQGHRFLETLAPRHIGEELFGLALWTDIFLGTKEYSEAHNALQKFVEKGQGIASSSEFMDYNIKRLTQKFP
jgi:transcriptional regulator with XRE-family HTH domain